MISHLIVVKTNDRPYGQVRYGDAGSVITGISAAIPAVLDIFGLGPKTKEVEIAATNAQAAALSAQANQNAAQIGANASVENFRSLTKIAAIAAGGIVLSVLLFGLLRPGAPRRAPALAGYRSRRRRKNR